MQVLSSSRMVPALGQRRCVLPRAAQLLLRDRRRRFFVRTAAGPDHISESAITLCSSLVAIGLPVMFTLLQKRVKEVQLKDIVRPGSIVLDVRTQAQRMEQGIPVLPEAVTIVHTPWLVQSGSFCKLNAHFADDVMFAAKDGTSNTPLVIMDMCGECGAAAAREVRKLGTPCIVKLALGGLQAWQSAGLPMAQLSDAGSRPGGSVDADDLLCELEDPPAEPPLFKPKLLEVLQSGYTMRELKQDVLSGLVVGVIALSLSMALGIASESTPAVGLTTAVVSGFLISALGGSRVSIGGPTAAFIPIVAGVAHQYGAENLVVCTGMSGLMLCGMGLLGLGRAISFIPKPVVGGFTAGIATYIFSTQIKDFIGLGVPGALPEGEVVPSQFLEKLYFLSSHLEGAHLPSVALACTSLALTLAWPKPWAKLLPPQIVTVVAATAGLVLLDHAVHGGAGGEAVAAAAAAAGTGAFGIETIGSHFGAGAIPSHLPMPHWPAALSEPQVLGQLVQPALSIAMLGSIESLLCARVSDSMIGDKHNPNTELIAQGIANIASAAVGGLPATGALARTAANVRSGGRSPVAGCVHAVTILAVMALAAPVAAYIPLPALSAVLVVVAINMGEWKHFGQLSTWPEKDAQLFLLAFFLTVMQDVTVAVELGMAAAVLLFVRDVTGSLSVQALDEGEELMRLEGSGSNNRRSNSRSPGPSPPVVAPTTWPVGLQALAPTPPTPAFSTSSGSASDEQQQQREEGEEGVKSHLLVPAGVAYLDVTGSLLFGAGHALEQACARVLSKRGEGGRKARVLVLSMRHLSTCDVSGLEVLEEVARALQLSGVPLVLAGPTKQPLQMMARAGFLQHVGTRNVCRTLEAAFERAEQLLQELHTPPASSSSSGQVANNVVGAPTYLTGNSSSAHSPSPATLRK